MSPRKRTLPWCPRCRTRTANSDEDAMRCDTCFGPRNVLPFPGHDDEPDDYAPEAA